MKKVHFILQGKGGIGKSMVASLIAQYQKQVDGNVTCLDIDPVNKTFSSIKSFNAISLKIVDSGGDIDSKKFDAVIQNILKADDDMTFVVDNGSSSYVSFSNYLVENDIGNELVSANCIPIIHVVLVGGQSQNDTLFGFVKYPAIFGKSYKYVAWVNPFFGDIDIDGYELEESSLYIQNNHFFDSFIKLPSKNRQTYGADFSKMLLNHQTFDEAMQAMEYSIMEKSRLHRLKIEIFKSIGDSFEKMGIHKCFSATGVE